MTPEEAKNFLSGISAHQDRPGDTANLHPDFAVRMATALQQARSEGLPVSLMSGFRAPDQTGSAYDASGKSSHSYGLASDIAGLDGPNGRVTTRWGQIAQANGLSNPYGIGNPREFNHWQLPPQPLETTPDILGTLKAASASGPQAMWNAYGGGAGTATPTESVSFTMPANAPAGMRNNNPLNIKFVPGLNYPGLVGPSKNTDQGDPQMVFATPQDGWNAAYTLIGKKYGGGKLTPNQIIAGQGGWTPGNTAAAANVARTMGIRPDEDVQFNDPKRAAAFMRALVTQEQGAAGKAYSDAMIEAAVTSRGTAKGGGSTPAAPGASSPATPTPATDTQTPRFVPMTPEQHFESSIGQALAGISGGGGAQSFGGVSQGQAVSDPLDEPAIRMPALNAASQPSGPDAVPAQYAGGIGGQLASLATQPTLVDPEAVPAAMQGLTQGAPGMTALLGTMGTPAEFNYLDPRRTVSPSLSMKGPRFA
jgi:hypothetical protein